MFLVVMMCVAGMCAAFGAARSRSVVLNMSGYGPSARVRRSSSFEGVVERNVALLEQETPPVAPAADVSAPVVASMVAPTSEIDKRKGYGPSARIVRRPVSSVATLESKMSTAVATATVVPIVPVVVSEFKVDEEIQRAGQLESLLGAFRGAVVEKEELLSLELNILQQMKDVRSKITDEAILAELAIATTQKEVEIDAERMIVTEIGQCADQLTQEISASKAKVSEWKGNAAGTEQSIVDWMRARDERILVLINRFDDITRQKGLSTAVPEKLAGIMDTAAVASTVNNPSAPLTVLSDASSITELAVILRSKSTAEMAVVAGTTLSQTGSSMVEVTSCLLTATSAFVFSPSSKPAGQAIGSAAAAIADAAKFFVQALSAASKAYTAIDEDPNRTDEGLLTVERVVAGIKNVLKSEDVLASLGLIGSSAGKVGPEVATAANVAASQVSTQLVSSDKYQNALQKLTQSLLTLIAILGAASSKIAANARSELSKQLPSGTNK